MVLAAPMDWIKLAYFTVINKKKKGMVAYWSEIKVNREVISVLS
jgi:hypothetical protein